MHVSYNAVCDEHILLGINYKIGRQQKVRETDIPPLIDGALERVGKSCNKVKVIDIHVSGNVLAFGNRFYRATLKENWKPREIKDGEIFGAIKMPAIPSQYVDKLEDLTHLFSWSPPNNPYVINNVYFFDACAKRMGLMTFSWHSISGFGNSYSRLSDNIKKDAETLLAKCPEVETIEVKDLGGTEYNPNPTYTKSKGWSVDAGSAFRAGNAVKIGLNGVEDMIYLGIEKDKLIGMYLGGRWGRLEGKVNYLVDNFKVTGLSFDGFWYEYGTSKKKCKKARNGFAYWGKFTFDIQADGTSSITHRNMCDSSDSPIDKGEAWWQLAEGKPVVDRFGFIQAQLEQDKLKLQAASTGEIGSDDLNPLAYLGYPESTLVFQYNNVDYYWVKYMYGTGIGFVAINDVSDDAPLLDIELSSFLSEGESIPGFRLSENSLNVYKNVILPKLEKHANGNQRFYIAFYNKSANLKNTLEQTRQKIVTTISPIGVTFTKKKDEWEQWVSDTKSGLTKLSLGSANTVKGAMVARAQLDREWEEKNRVARLTPQQRGAERMLQIEKEDKLGREAAEAKGSVYRDWLYWQQYSYGEHYKEILAGTYETEYHKNILPHLYLRLFGAFSQACANSVPEGSPGIDYYTNTTIKDGYFTSEIKRYDGSIRVKQRYWPQFKRFHDDPPVDQLISGAVKALEDRNNVIRNVAKYMGESQKFANNLNHDSDLLIRNEGCDSSFMQQLQENIYAAAAGLPYVQQSNVKLSYSSRDAGGKNTSSEFFQSCMKAKGSSFEYDQCRCLDDGFSKAFTTADSNKYSRDYWLLFDAAIRRPKTADDPLMRLHNVFVSCRR